MHGSTASAEHLDVVRAAATRADTSVFAERALTRHTVWSGSQGSVVARHHDRLLVFAPPTSASLHEIVRGLVGVSPGLVPAPCAGEPEAALLPAGVLTHFVAAMAGRDAGRAASQLASVRDDLSALRLLHGLALGQHRTWSVERRVPGPGAVVRRVPDGDPARAMTVIDSAAGPAWVHDGADRFQPVGRGVLDRRLGSVLACVGTVAACPSCPRWRPSAGSSNRG